MSRFVVIVACAILAAVQAFAPKGRAAIATVRMAFTKGPLAGLPGADGPESKNFDPLGFAEKAPEWVPWFREAEIKHGRIAMLAALGFAATDCGLRIQGDIHNVASKDAHSVFVESGAMAQILIWTSLLEIIWYAPRPLTSPSQTPHRPPHPHAHPPPHARAASTP